MSLLQMALCLGLATTIEEDEKNKELKKMRSATPEEVKSVNAYVDNISQNVLTIPIPTNATNGDVIKAMFPNIDFTEMAFTVHASTKVTSNGVKGGISYDFWKEWWDAPYKAESEDK